MIPPSSHAGPAGTPEAFAEFYASLATRKAGDFKALHVLAASGFLFALDFGVMTEASFPAFPYAKREYPCKGLMRTADTLIAECDSRLAELGEMWLMPRTFEQSWRDFWDAPFIGMRPVNMEHAVRGRAFFVLRGNL